MCKKLEEIRQRVAEACKRAGRQPQEVKIVAVSKTKTADMVRGLYRCGQRVFGENYVQEAVNKIQKLSDLKDMEYHFIGHLQRNKAKLVARYFDWVETIDSIRLARTLDRHACAIGKRLNVLVQVNVGKEESKHGLFPEEVPPVLEEMAELSNLRVRGLMTIHPISQSKEDARHWFRKMVTLRNEFSDAFPQFDLSQLSMGMSGDFEEAIEEGATIVRIGTALFGPRK